jgi:uncharacterized protein
MRKMFLDPWPPDFDPPVSLDPALYDGPVDTTIETGIWEAISNPQQRLFGKVFFLDGARRIDARVLVQTEAGTTVHGLFGTTAAGCVESEGTMARIRTVDIKRLLILGGGIVQHQTLDIGGSTFHYEGFATQAESPQDVLGKLQYLMRENEARLGQALLSEGSCVFVDGPLTYFSSSCESMVGVVKKIQQPYLDPLHFGLVSRLEPGQRTPLFHIPDPKHERYSWYLRLAPVRRIDHAMSSILRLEVRVAIGVDAAVRLADFSSLELPRFASTAARDPRAPQNLVPIGALESEMHRQMGDAMLVRRAIERRLSSQ